jgi:RNA polymerase sigma-70 factor, ECF subfamily
VVGSVGWLRYSEAIRYDAASVPTEPRRPRASVPTGPARRGGREFPVSQQSISPDFAQIVAQNYQRVYSVIYRLIEDREEAEDLTQDTFVNAYRAYGEFRHESHVYTWLYRIAVNLTKNRLDRRSRRRVTEGVSLDSPVEIEQDELSRQIEDWSTTPDRIFENRSLGDFLACEVKALRPEYKTVVVLRDYESLSYEEIARVVGISVQAVKSRLFRARTVLRERLTEFEKGEC